MLESPKDRYFYFGYTMMAVIAVIFVVAILFSIVETFESVRATCRSIMKRKKEANSVTSNTADIGDSKDTFKIEVQDMNKVRVEDGQGDAKERQTIKVNIVSPSNKSAFKFKGYLPRGRQTSFSKQSATDAVVNPTTPKSSIQSAFRISTIKEQRL